MQCFIERERCFLPLVGCHWTSLQVAFSQQGLPIVQHFAFPQYCNSNSNHTYAHCIPQDPCNSQFINAAITQRLNNLNKRRLLTRLGEDDIESKCRPADDSWEVFGQCLENTHLNVNVWISLTTMSISWPLGHSAAGTNRQKACHNWCNLSRGLFGVFLSQQINNINNYSSHYLIAIRDSRCRDPSSLPAQIFSFIGGFSPASQPQSSPSCILSYHFSCFCLSTAQNYKEKTTHNVAIDNAYSL